jgi:hypothetical protein
MRIAAILSYYPHCVKHIPPAVKMSNPKSKGRFPPKTSMKTGSKFSTHIAILLAAPQHIWVYIHITVP